MNGNGICLIMSTWINLTKRVKGMNVDTVISVVAMITKQKHLLWVDIAAMMAFFLDIGVFDTSESKLKIN